jgi:hypothetical protein
MRSLALVLFCTIPISLQGCATLNDSMELGGGIGATTGALAVISGHAGTGHSASFTDVAVATSIGAGLGILASYLVHRSVETERESMQSDQTEMHFGDLPPSPFIIPHTKFKKGVR